MSIPLICEFDTDPTVQKFDIDPINCEIDYDLIVGVRCRSIYTEYEIDPAIDIDPVNFEFASILLL